MLLLRSLLVFRNTIRSYIDFSPGVVGYIVLRPLGGIVTVSDLRFNDVQRKGSTIMVASTSAEPTTVQAAAEETGHYTIQVVNELGQKIRTLWDGRLEGGQVQQLSWDGKDGNGNQIASGVYFWQVVRDGQVVGLYQIVKR